MRDKAIALSPTIGLSMAFIDGAGWTSNGFTYTWNGGHAIDEITVARCLDGWRLISENPDFQWHAQELGDLEHQFQFLIAHAQEIDALKSRPLLSINGVEHGNATLRARRLADGCFVVEAFDRARDPVSKYEGHLNGAMSAWMLDKNSISGSHHISDERFRRTGLGDKMRDLAQDLMELPAVPSGMRVTSSGMEFDNAKVSPAAQRSWIKRNADVKPVPGLTTDVGMRVRCRLAFESENHFMTARELRAQSVACSIELAKKTNLPISLGYVNGSLQFAWVVAENGTPISPLGWVDQDCLIRTSHRGDRRG